VDIRPSTHGTAPPADLTTEESRRATRFRQEPKTAFALIHESPVGENLRVEVFDESLFGICLVMADTRGLVVGTEVEMSYFASPLHATVKHITQRENGAFLIGLATRPLLD